jgi:signal transduction histidine kinase
MALQRQRFTESQVLDQRSRRTLHDDILPALHAAMLQLSGRGENAEALAQLGEVHRQLSALLREMPTGLASQVSTLGLLPALRQMVEQESPSAFDTVTWEVEPEAEAQARTIPALTADVVFYAAKEAIRNAARHGRGGDATRPLHLTVAARWRHGLELHVSDDGVGRAATAPAIPTSGQGLALHSTLMTVIGGSLLSESLPDRGTTVTLFLPEERVGERQK